jgi:hypothetical protein
MNFSKSELLQFISIVITTNHLSHLAYILVDSAAFHYFRNVKFIWILGLVRKISMIMIIMIVNNHLEEI